MDERRENDRKSALPAGFGESEGQARWASRGPSLGLSAAVAAIVAGAVVAVVPRAIGISPRQDDALAQRLGQLEVQHARLNERLGEMDAKLAALASEPSVKEPPSNDAVSSARAALEARVAAGDVSAEELRTLRALCRQQDDKECSDRATDLLAAMPDSAPSPEGEAVPGTFNKVEAIRTLAEASKRARACGALEGRSGDARVTVTFEPSGVVSVVQISGAIPRKDAAKSCVQAAFRQARVPAFEGQRVKVTKTAQLVGPDQDTHERTSPDESEVEF